jgi:hypothetical protein
LVIWVIKTFRYDLRLDCLTDNLDLKPCVMRSKLGVQEPHGNVFVDTMTPAGGSNGADYTSIVKDAVTSMRWRMRAAECQ